MIIYPTNTCFDDALDFLSDCVIENQGAILTHTLVHGILRSPTGVLYAHAWVEVGTIVWDAGILEDGTYIRFSVSREEYETSKDIVETTRYSVLEATRENLRTGTYGPWEPRYVPLCKDSDKELKHG